MAHQQISKEDREYLKEMTEYRKGLYHLLASLFIKEQTREELDALRTVALDSNLDATVFDGERAFLVYLTSLKDVDLEELAGDLRAEYARLFLGPRPKKAPPYESIYRGSPRRLFTDITMHARECYRRAGFEILTQGQEPDDHIGFELEFMRELCATLLNTLLADEFNLAEAHDTIHAQEAFRSGHLAKWVEPFSTVIREETNQQYFVALADLLESFIEEDAQFIEKSLDILTFWDAATSQ